MKLVKFFILGLLFGTVLTKAEIISWYRIQEMFRFQSFHMYGVIGSAVVLGIISLFIIKKFKVKNQNGSPMSYPTKEIRFYGYLFGGIIFGLGWALTGSCPGPMYIIFGYGYSVFLIVILSALLGTFTYGLLKKYLPH